MKIEFPIICDVDVCFGNYPTDFFDKVLKNATENGVDKKYTSMAESLFFKGGTVPLNKNLDKEYIRNGTRMLKCILGSFNPKHEHKELVCGAILQAICK